MIIPAAILFLAAFLTALLGTFLARRFARGLGLMDAPGHRKVHTKATPRNGGIGIFWGFALPLVAAIVAISIVASHLAGHDPVSVNLWGALIRVPDQLGIHLPGMRAHAPLALLLLAATFGI